MLIFYSDQVCLKIAFRVRVIDNKTLDTTIETNVKLCDTNNVFLPHATLYHPYISYAIYLVNEFMAAIRLSHNAAIHLVYSDDDWTHNSVHHLLFQSIVSS